MARRRRALVAIAAGAALLAIGGLVASTFIKSPEQVAAESRAPRASWITEKVEKRVLSDTLIVRGTITSDAQVQVNNVTAREGATPVVTAVRVKAGQTVAPGDVLLEIAGRPLLVLPGKVPGYRDLKPNDSGDDVAQFQEALRSLGFNSGADAKGYFGPGTKAAVTTLYHKAGYNAPDTGGPGGAADKSKLQSAQEAVDQAQRTLDNLKRQAAATKQAPPTSSASAGDPSGGGDKPAKTDPGGEPLDVQLKYQQQALTRAKSAQKELVSSTGPMMPVAEFVFLPSFPAQVAQISAKTGEPAKAPLATLSSGGLNVVAKLSPEQASLLHPGMKAQIVSETLGREVAGTVTDVGAPVNPVPDAAQSGAGASGGSPYVPVTVAPGQKLPVDWAGQDVRLTVTSAATQGEVLVVPLAAVTSAADGRATLTKLISEDDTVRVEVVVGITGSGFIEVRPVATQALAPGDRVVVGR